MRGALSAGSQPLVGGFNLLALGVEEGEAVDGLAVHVKVVGFIAYPGVVPGVGQTEVVAGRLAELGMYILDGEVVELVAVADFFQEAAASEDGKEVGGCLEVLFRWR